MVDSPEETVKPGLLRALSSMIFNRFQFAQQAGMSFNGQRNMYDVLGYARVLTYAEYRARYTRGGIAKRIVEAYAKATWRGGVELFEDEDPKTDTEFEQQWQALEDRLNVWSTLQSVDILSGLSTYAVLLIGADGDLSQELPRGKGPDSLLYLTPFSGGGGPASSTTKTRTLSTGADATIREFETNTASPRFGDPLSYQLKRMDLASPEFQKPVHWSRIIHVAEGRLEDNVYGQPVLENCWNLLDDLDKVTGGGAEAFWLRANAGLNLNVEADAMLSPNEKKAINDTAEDYAHQMTRILQTRKVDVKQLGSQVANFAESAGAILQQIAGSKGIPMRILTGSEMGQLASGQDADNWNTQVWDRRTSYAGPRIVRALVDRLIEYGYLVTPEQYEVGWPVEEDLTELEKAELAVQLATTNKTQGSMVFPPNFIRDKCFDLEALTVAEDVPLVAPERVSATAPTPPEDEVKGVKNPALPAAKPTLVAASDVQKTLKALERAIEKNDLKAIGKLLDLEEAS